MIPESGLSRREREVMEIVHRLESATAAEIRAEMDDPPTNPAVRSTLRSLVDKGHLEFEWDGPRHVYSPAVPPGEARRTALQKLIHTFFDGSAEGAMAALLEARGPLSSEEKRRLMRIIEENEEEER